MLINPTNGVIVYSFKDDRALLHPQKTMKPWKYVNISACHSIGHIADVSRVVMGRLQPHPPNLWVNQQDQISKVTTNEIVITI